ncbi:polymorphic toxin-type HINT domain-containing protein [Stieleria sp. TO1_6]|uniref:polymorphic toxin-type HINT domain-containing protein n=1 Tax=Stieleria tagensis TaxID=2956795 RepID=UPI00209AC18B|nr:polymorphic toxin-type HINT domain-containing protein [Stieleria tagensis]MCO8125389.1 polymorphic toxin-type HINT domain-containing protein [Stieleria tagensis]
MDDSHRDPVLHHVRASVGVMSLAVALISHSWSTAEDTHRDSETLVQKALQAELDGNLQQRQVYLASAIQQDPNDSAARWHAGFVQQGKQWMTPAESAALNSQSELISQYQVLRDQHLGSLAGEIALARWCRINGLEDREQMHWRNVIRVDSSNDEARGRLRLKNFRGQPMTQDEIEAFKRASGERKRALRTWGSKLVQLRREIEATHPVQFSSAWRKLAEISDPDAVPSLEKMVATAGPDLQQHLINTLGNIKHQSSAEALVRLSLDSKDSPVRQAAAETLAGHSLHAFTPNYLGRLQSPVEYESSLNSIGDSVFSHTLLRQERPDNVVNVVQSTNAGLTIESPVLRFTPAYRQIVTSEVYLQRMKIARTEQAVEQNNARVRRANEPIFTALRTSTGQEMTDDPQLWWDWWKKYNEYAVATRKPEYYFTNTEVREGTMRLPRPRSCECFPAGTLVHTETGKRAIEMIRSGDKVLSQNPDTGEVSYQLVTQTTVRPPSDTMQITLANEQITATLGHPFWVVGKGWTMAKGLNPGDRLHGIGGASTIDVVEGGIKSEAYNLVVDQTNSYFVGNTGYLVHDSKLRSATQVPLPGWDTHLSAD